MTRIRRRLMTAGLLTLLGASAPAFAEGPSYKSLIYNGSANTVTGARVLVAPLQETNALIIRRIRLANSASSTSPSYRFLSRTSSRREGETQDASSCDLPDCFQLLAAEAVKAGTLFDYTGLDIPLPASHRLEFYATADINSESKYLTIEVWYDEVKNGVTDGEEDPTISSSRRSSGRRGDEGRRRPLRDDGPRSR